MTEPRIETPDTQDALDFALSRFGQPHQHHRHCIHNLSAEEQKAGWLRRLKGDQDLYDIIYGEDEPTVITPEDWEIDVPDLDYSRFDGES